MQWIQVTEGKWEDIRHDLRHKKNLSGAYIVNGSSEDLAIQIGQLFEEVLQAQYYLYYFLCSGSENFCVPCYFPTSDRQVIPDILIPHHVLDSTGFRFPPQPFCSPHQTLNRLKELVADRQGTPQLVVLECLTTPKKNEQVFIKLLLQSVLSNYVPIIVFVHQEGDTHEEVSLFVNTMHDEIHFVLYAMYMCGGRIEKTEFDKLLHAKHIANHHVERYVVPRCIQEETWFSYRNKSMVKHIEKQFYAMNMEEKQELAKSILPLLPLGIVYPLLAITYYISDTELMLSKYSLNAVRSSLASTPKVLLTYFRKLRKQARKERNPDLFLCATVNYLAALMFVNERNIIRIYNILLSGHYQDERIAMISFDLFFALGQGLSRKKDTHLLTCALDCYQRCHTLMSKIPYTHHKPKKILFAAISNGEALIALKQGNYEKALQFESTALLELSDIENDPHVDTQRVLLKTHISDLLMRSPDKIQMAIVQYEEAYALAVTCVSLDAQLYVVPKLVRAYTKIHNYQKMIPMLEDLLSAWNQNPEFKAESRATTGLNIILPLAQAYMAMKQLHKAALCYLSILLEPDQISPAVLKGITTNLKHCLLGENTFFWVWVESIISEQEKRFAGIAELCNLLSSL